MNDRSTREALALLGLEYPATKEEIKSAYHRLAAICHPDAGKYSQTEAKEAFLRVHEAYEFLCEAFSETEAAAPQEQRVRSAEVVRAVRTPEKVRTVGGDAAIRAFWERNERQPDKIRKKKKSRRDKELAAVSGADSEYEEAMLMIHAIRAAEVAARIMGIRG